MTTSSPAAPPRAIEPESGVRPNRWLWAVRIGVPLLVAAAALATPGFVSTPSLYAVLTTMSFIGCIALGMTLITISGNIMSFCLGATTSATTIVFVVVLNWLGLVAALVASLAFGALLTGLQGLIIGWFRANPIIVSIAMLSLINGFFQAVTQGLSYYPEPGTGVELLKGRLLGLPIEFVVFLLALAVAQTILSLTVFGRHLFLVGDSPAAAEAAGIMSWRSIGGAYLWAGLFAAVAGILLASRFAQGNMQFAQGYDYGAIAAVLVGGTAIQGGSGSALRTLVGILFITVVQVVLLLHGLSQQWQYFNLGAIVLAVIMLQTSRVTAAAPAKVLAGKRLPNPHLRPLGLLLATVAVMVAFDGGQGRILSDATAFSALQTFATIGLVALGLGVAMIGGEFDLSVAGTFGMAGCIAVMTGAEYPPLGIVLAMLAGIAAGVSQALIMIRLRIGSTGVTLGGLLLFIGIAYVLTSGRSVPYANMDVALAVNARVAGLFSIRSLVTAAIFVAVACVVGMTRVGRDLIAMGSDRRAATLAGVDVPALIVGTFAFSGAMAALSGALLGYSLATASPAGLSDVLVPGTAAAILGGVSLSGGMGRPMGIAAGVLTLATLRGGLNGLGASPALQDIVTGSILIAVAIADGGATTRRIGDLLSRRRRLRGTSSAA
jgi:ribose/xylose/arabinose/galactoside ABC-type transport system permease subunit